MSTEFVTRHEFESAMSRIDARFDRLESQLELRFAAIDSRFGEVESRFAVTEARLETKIEAATVTSIRWTVGMAFGVYAMMFGLILFVISRELPR